MKTTCKASLNTNTDENDATIIDQAHSYIYVGSTYLSGRQVRPIKNNYLRMKSYFYLSLFAIAIIIFSSHKAQGQPLNADFTVNSNSPLQASFEEQNHFNNVTYNWSFGDGSNDTSCIYCYFMEHTYAQAGIYRVCLSIISTVDLNNKASSCKNVIIEDTVDLAASIINANEVNFTVSPTGNNITINHTIPTNDSLVYFWDFGDGTTSTKRMPSHTYIDNGNYDIKLTLRDTKNNKIYTYIQPVVIGISDCPVNFTYYINDTFSTIKFTNTSPDTAALHFLWWFGDGSYSTSTSPSIKKYNPGTYKVTLVGIDNPETPTCVDQKTAIISVGNIKCNAEFNYFVDSASNTVYFNAISVGSPTTYYWVFGDGTTSAKARPVHLFKAPGFHKVSLHIADTMNNCYDSKSQHILVGRPDIDINAEFFFFTDPQTHFTTFKTFKSLALGSNLKYLWNFGDGSTDTVAHPTHHYTKGGNYNACLTVYNNQTRVMACKKVSVRSDITHKCQADFIYLYDSTLNRISCINRSVGFDTNIYYAWRINNGPVNQVKNPSWVLSDTGFFKVSLQISDFLGCKDKKHVLVKGRSTKQGIKAAFVTDKGDSSRIKASGYPVDFVAIAHGDAAKLKWSFGDGTYDSTTANPTHWYNSPPDEYEVCLEIWDPITNEYDIYCNLINVAQINNIEEKKTATTGTITSLSVNPNPIKDIAIIQYNLAMESTISIDLHHIEGTKVQTLFHGNKAAGSHSLVFNTGGLASGLYLLVMQNETVIITRKVLIVE